MPSNAYFAQTFINSFEIDTERIEEGIETLKRLGSWASSLPNAFFENTAAEKLEALAREKIKTGEIFIGNSSGSEAYSDSSIEIALRFLILMIKKKIFCNFDSVMDTIEKQLDKRRGIIRVFVDYVFPLEEDMELKIKEVIKKKTGANKVELTGRQCPELIGGYRLQIGDEVIDASILSQLKKLKTCLKEVDE